MDSFNCDIPINIIGYGNWGSRVAKKLESSGYQIQNLVTDKKDVFVNCKNILTRNLIEEVDKNLPTFILTGPLYHHEIISLFNKKVFVEKPFNIKNKKNSYKNNPYVNYLWYNSSKIKKIKEIIPNNFLNLDIQFFSANYVDRKLTILEDFLPHMICILKSLELDDVTLHSVEKVSTTIYKSKFILDNKNITFEFGFSNKTYTRFIVDEKIIESNTFNTINFEGTEIIIGSDPLEESIKRYYNYYLTGECETPFISDDFHNLVYQLTYSFKE